jgi:hypothetical protein
MAANELIDVKPKPISWQSTAKQRSPGSALARFLELRGRKIVRACGTLWYTVPGGFLMSLPYQAMLDPDPKELRSVIGEARVLGARFPSATWSGLESGLYIMRPSGYTLDVVHPKHRPRVRRGLQCFEVRPATKAELLSQGRALNLSTMARQGRYDSEFGEPRRWAALVEAAFACSEVSIPAAFDRSRLVAFMVTCREQGWLHILHQMSLEEDLSNFPNHVLTYVVTSQAAADPTLDWICYGCAPLFQAPGLHEYKLRFGYEMVPHRSAIQLHPAVSAALTCPATLEAVRVARSVMRRNQWLETLQTVLEGARCSGPHGGLS